MSDLSEYFDQSKWARAWLNTDGGRLSEAWRNLFFTFGSLMHLPQFIERLPQFDEWLDRKLTRKAQR